jgi:hypothetical protein
LPVIGQMGDRARWNRFGRRAAVLAAICAATLGCADRQAAVRPADATTAGYGSRTATLLFGGDVMLGRGVAAAADPAGVLAGVRMQVSSADLAAANLESPLTVRPHAPAAGPNALEARPSAARTLAATGFDVLGIANNHAGDAGPETVADTMRSLAAAGLRAVGRAGQAGPLVVPVGGVRVALLAFDATGLGPATVARWDEAVARAAVTRARAEADVVAVGIHGGAEYRTAPDPYLSRLGRLLASWGADVVWCSGPHVVQPVRVVDPDGDGRPTVVATSLGNLLFDQHLPGTQRGALVEVLAGADGVRALRIGSVQATAPARFLGWRRPGAAAVALAGGWWTLVRPAAVTAKARPQGLTGFPGDVVDAALGDPDGDGRTDLVVSFRRPFSPGPAGGLVPRRLLADARGRSAHVGLYRPTDLRPRWVAGLLLRPVAEVSPCDGTLAVAYSTLDDPAVTGTGAWRWGGFGFVPLPDLPGAGVPACSDIDGDGRLDPVVLERSS